ncbi:MAG: hypothetical protein WAM96_13615, partial [Candidatus Acidiferrales bacterium]
PGSTHMPQIHKMALKTFSTTTFFAIRTFFRQAKYPIKPDTGDRPQYVSANGNNGNDGLSGRSAKLIVMAAYAAPSARGGTIYA